MAVMQKNYLFGSAGRGRRLLPVYLLLPGVFLYFLIALGPSMATAVLSFTDISGLRGASVQLDRIRQLPGVPLRGAGVA